MCRGAGGGDLTDLDHEPGAADRRGGCSCGQHSPANKALELLGCEIGMFGDRTPADISLDNPSFDDLTKLVAELEADPEVQEELEKRSRR
jgi:hypothetical protein